MNILLYNPDNGVTRNFMPHLWMFLLQALTPPQHKVHLIDGNAQPLSEADLKDFIARHQIRLVGIGAMTRMAARAYQMADAARAAGALVVWAARTSLNCRMKHSAAMVDRGTVTPSLWVKRTKPGREL